MFAVVGYHTVVCDGFILSYVIYALMLFLTVPNVELSPMCSSRFRPGPPGEQAQVLSQFVNEVVIK